MILTNVSGIIQVYQTRQGYWFWTGNMPMRCSMKCLSQLAFEIEADFVLRLLEDE